MTNQPVIDLEFPLKGQAIPVDHGYALYAACCRIVPSLHSDRSSGILPVQGGYGGGAHLQLDRRSKLTFRIRADQVGRFLPIAGKKIEVEGYPLAVGVPQLRMLRPTSSLLARTVTIAGFKGEKEFLEALRRQLNSLAPDAGASLLKRRTIRVAGKQVVGFKVLLDGLLAGESLDLQERGIGGRRRFGCGLFLPVRR